MRGARTGDNPAPHLLAALDQASGVVVGQRRVLSDESNEIPALPDLLAPSTLTGPWSPPTPCTPRWAPPSGSAIGAAEESRLARGSCATAGSRSAMSAPLRESPTGALDPRESSPRAGSAGQNPGMRTATAPDDRLRTLQYWWMLELFSPQKVLKPIKRSTRPEGRQVIEWRPGEPLPWWSLRRPTSAGRTRRRWQHTVYLGVYDLEDVYQYLHHAFAEDRDAYDERRAGSSACAAVMLDDRGVLMVDSATLSSALWAVAQIRDSGAAPSPQWAGGFSRAAQEFKKEADVVEGLRREAALAETAPPQDLLPRTRTPCGRCCTSPTRPRGSPARPGWPVGGSSSHRPSSPITAPATPLRTSTSSTASSSTISRPCRWPWRTAAAHRRCRST